MNLYTYTVASAISVFIIMLFSVVYKTRKFQEREPIPKWQIWLLCVVVGITLNLMVTVSVEIDNVSTYNHELYENPANCTFINSTFFNTVTVEASCMSSSTMLTSACPTCTFYQYSLLYSYGSYIGTYFTFCKNSTECESIINTTHLCYGIRGEYLFSPVKKGLDALIVVLVFSAVCLILFVSYVSKECVEYNRYVIIGGR